jgi:hypothetical protein
MKMAGEFSGLREGRASFNAAALQLRKTQDRQTDLQPQGQPHLSETVVPGGGIEPPTP